MSNNINKQHQTAPPPLPSLTDKKLYFSYGSGFSLRTGSKLSSGFTIIEVALVLAIAGLIFLVVFLALPALQNSQKDMARREDVGRVVAALQSYKIDNGGDLSGLVSGDVSGNWTIIGITPTPLGSYVGKLGPEIRQVAIAPSMGGNALNPGVNEDINIFIGSSCGDNTNLSSVNAAVTVRVANKTQVYCQSL